MLKYKADIRTLIYFVITASLFAWQWSHGFHATSLLDWAVYIAFLHFSIAIAVITHNHNHINMWANKSLNTLTDWFLSIFYGLPIFVWIPTHNRNHHRHVNKIEDVTRTYRHTEENDTFSLLLYPTISGSNQMKESILPYMRDLKAKNPVQYRENWMQLIVLIVWEIVFFALNWKLALVLVFIPQQVAQLSVIVFNYVQHVHADEESDYNHSRNFTGVNAFLFNNGYHTIHHHKAALHWSETPEAHKKIEHLINPELIESSLWWYLFRTYLLSNFVAKYRSHNMRADRMQHVKETSPAQS